MPVVFSRRVVVAVVAAWLLLASLVCFSAADARAHLVGDHESLAHATAPDAPAGPALAATDAHPECGDALVSAALGVAPVKLLRGLAAAAAPERGALAPASSGAAPGVARATGSPPAESPGSLPLRI